MFTLAIYFGTRYTRVLGSSTHKRRVPITMKKGVKMSSPIKPMAHYVVAVKEKKPEKTASGIFLPESAQEKSEAAKVVAVGSEIKEVKNGQNVVYKNYAATTIKIEKEEYLIIKDEDILATVED